ncbi:hypothetical protein ROHU_036474 [Labeo rohita]|uniref:Tc1-like transposase DDE domain-containing protein n=1 Tax=Labeo rohita TaxID=84645 RepID=A0A498N486_LABRO|nr:hypothetical protein ROHU_036474 [Labeo rohita]
MERVRERVRRRGGQRGGGREGGGGRGGRGINRGRGRDGGHAGGRRRGRGRGRGRRRQEGAQRGQNLTNEIRATLVDHVVNHGLTLREAGLIEGQERQGGRPPMFTEQQAREIVNMVLANSAITLKQLQANIVNNHASFNDIHQLVRPLTSLSSMFFVFMASLWILSQTVDPNLHLKFGKPSAMRLVPLSATGMSPFECSLGYLPPLFPVQENDVAVPSVQDHIRRCSKIWREARSALLRSSDRNRPYTNQRVMELEANQVPHEIIYVDEDGFNLAKRRRRGRNIIGQRATVTVPGQRGANITMCAAISNNGALLHKCQIGPYNTDRLLLFLEDLHERLVPEVERGQVGDHLPIYVITWDNVAFHHSRAVTAWFDAHPRMMSHFLAPYSPFLNPIEEFFSAWRWKVFDHRPHDQMSLLDAMDAACKDITAEHCQGWIRHAKRFFPRCLAREDIRCDVDENMWPNAEDWAE